MDKTDFPGDSHLLLEAFQSFSEASQQLEQVYAELQAHTEKLDLELRNTNEKLKESLWEQERANLHLQSILNSLKTGILVIDLDGTVLNINPSARKLLAVEARVAPYTDLGLPGEVESFIENCLANTHSRVPKMDITVLRDDEQRDLELSFALVRPEGGGIMSVLIIINDMTLIHRLQSQSNRTTRLAAMGEMAAELAHEIRNPLGSIKLFSSLLEKDLAERPDTCKLATQITHGVQIIENIVSNVLAYSANVTPQQTRLEVGELLKQCFPLFELDLTRKEIQFQFDEPTGPLKIMGDPHLLKQMVLNLCLNAIKAMEPEGLLKVAATARDDFVEIVITDNGCGIPENQLHKIFDPFYTTFNGGTGLGLSVVNQIIEKHGGALEIKSQPGKGTAVYVTVPALPHELEVS